MTERNVLSAFKKLKLIVPERSFVLQTKKNVLGNDFGTSLSTQIVKIFSYFTLSALALGSFVFVLAQRSLPGDALYSVKKITQKIKIAFINKDKSLAQLDLINNNFNELNKIVEINDAKKLSPALKEVKSSFKEASVALRDSSPNINKNLVDKITKIENNKKIIEKTLGTAVGNNEYDEYNAVLSDMIEKQINNLEQKSLTESQTEILKTAKTKFAEGKFDEALSEILKLNELNK